MEHTDGSGSRGVFAFAGDGSDSGQETPTGFGDDPAPQWQSQVRRRRGAETQLRNAATQRVSQAPTQKDSGEATQPVTQLDGGPPMFVVAEPSQDPDDRQLEDEDVDEDETQILMLSMSQGGEAMAQAAASKILEEELTLHSRPPSATGHVGAFASTVEDSDLSDDMLEQDGLNSDISLLAASFKREVVEVEPRKRRAGRSFAPHSSFRLSSSAVSRDLGGDSSGGDTELEPEHEDLARSNSEMTGIATTRANSTPSAALWYTPERSLHRSLSTPDHAGRAPMPESNSKRLQDSSSTTPGRSKRVRLLGRGDHSSCPTPKLDLDQIDGRSQASKPSSTQHDTPSRTNSFCEASNPDGVEVSSSRLVKKPSRRRIPLVPTQPQPPPPDAASEAAADGDSVGNRVAIVLTGLEPTAAIRKQIKAISGATYHDNVEDATHVVAPSNQLKRTVKLLCGISRCVHILDESWLDESARVGAAVDEKEHCLTDDTAEEKWQFSLRDTMYSVSLEQRQQLFAGRHFFIVNHKSVLPPVKDLVKIVECAGGTAVCKGTAAAEDVVITTEAALGAASVQKALAKANSERIYSPELILTSILRQSVDLAQHRVHLPRSMKGRRSR